MIAERRDDDEALAARGRFTMTPNELLDHHMALLSPTEFKIVMYVVRRTIGFGRDGDAISIAQMADGLRDDGTILDRGTGESRATIKRALAALVAKGYLAPTRQRDQRGGDAPTLYALRLPPVAQNEPPPLAQNEPPPWLKMSHPVAQNEPHKRKVERKKKERGHDDGMPAVQPAARASSSPPPTLVVQRGLAGQPTRLTPTRRPENGPPAAVTRALDEIVAGFGPDVERPDEIRCKVLALWEQRAAGVDAPAFCDRLRYAAERAIGKDNPPGWFRSDVARVLSGRVKRKAIFHDATSSQQRVAEPNGRVWHDQTPDLSDVPRIDQSPPPRPHLDPVPVRRVR